MKKRAIVVAIASLILLAAACVSAFPQGEAAPARGQRVWKRSLWGWGIGGVVNNLPIATSTFNVPLQYVCYQHTLGEDPEAPFDELPSAFAQQRFPRLRSGQAGRAGQYGRRQVGNMSSDEK